jgi:hypothetical protein
MKSRGKSIAHMGGRVGSVGSDETLTIGVAKWGKNVPPKIER